MKDTLATSWTCIKLDHDCSIERGRLPPGLLPSRSTFEQLWALHPDAYHTIRMRGRLVQTPRWQQAFGEDYRYTGRINRALPVPPLLAPFLAWVREAIDPRQNGLLLNWYDPALAHYIGRHRDSTSGMVQGAPIVTVSLGAARVFRLRPWRGDAAARVDIPVDDGSVVILPYAVNLAWTHEVPFRPSLDHGRRISVTTRAFGPSC